MDTIGGHITPSPWRTNGRCSLSETQRGKQRVGGEALSPSLYPATPFTLHTNLTQITR